MFSYFVLKLYFEVAGHVHFEIAGHVGGLEILSLHNNNLCTRRADVLYFMLQ